MGISVLFDVLMGGGEQEIAEILEVPAESSTGIYKGPHLPLSSLEMSLCREQTGK